MPNFSIPRRKETIVTIVFFAVIACFSFGYAGRLAFPARAPARPSENDLAPPEISGKTASPSLFHGFAAFERRVESLQQSVNAFIEEETDLWLRFSELNMGIRKRVGMRLTPGDWPVVELPNGHLATYRGPSDADRCARAVIRFHAFAQQQGIPFLFVMIPYKQAQQQDQMPPDYPDSVPRNANRFVHRLQKSNVPLLDLRPALEQLGGDYFRHFFRTDHHWRPETALWAAAAIATELQRRYAIPFDPLELDPSRFRVESASQPFLGSFGRKVTLAYADPEDFPLVTPTHATDFSVRIPGTRIQRRGPFHEVLIDVNERLLAEGDLYKGTPFAYMYGNRPLIHVRNHLRHDGRRLLILKDSFSNFATPFQALTAEYLDIIDLRHFTGSLQDYIRKSRPDAILVQYYAENITTSSLRRAQRVDLFGFD